MELGGNGLRRGRRDVPLAQVPPVLLAECYADYRAVTDVAGEAPLREDRSAG